MSGGARIKAVQLGRRKGRKDVAGSLIKGVRSDPHGQGDGPNQGRGHERLRARAVNAIAKGRASPLRLWRRTSTSPPVRHGPLDGLGGVPPEAKNQARWVGSERPRDHDHDERAWPAHAGELGEHARQLAQVVENETTQDDVHRRGPYRQGAHIGTHKLRWYSVAPSLFAARPRRRGDKSIPKKRPGFARTRPKGPR